MFYDNLFLGFYNLNKKHVPKSEQPILNAILLVSLLSFCNILSISLVTELITGFKLINLENITGYTVVVIAVALILLHYFLLGYKKRYKTIIEKSQSQTSEKVAIIYFITTVLLLLFASASFLIKA